MTTELLVKAHHDFLKKYMLLVPKRTEVQHDTYIVSRTYDSQTISNSEGGEVRHRITNCNIYYTYEATRSDGSTVQRVLTSDTAFFVAVWKNESRDSIGRRIKGKWLNADPYQPGDNWHATREEAEKAHAVHTPWFLPPPYHYRSEICEGRLVKVEYSMIGLTKDEEEMLEVLEKNRGRQLTREERFLSKLRQLDQRTAGVIRSSR